MASVVYAVGGNSSTSDPWLLDLGTHSFTSGNRVLFFMGMHGASPVITTIEFSRAGVGTGTMLTKLGDVLIPGQAYWEVWMGVLPSTGNDYELDIDPASSIAGGAGYMLIETDATVTEFGTPTTGTYSGTTTAMPVVTTDREAILLCGAHNDFNYSITSTIDDSFTKTTVASRTFMAYRYASSGITTAAEITWDGSSESGEATMIPIYLTAAELRGSFVFGVNTTVTESRAVAFGLDGNTNTHAESSVLKVFGKASVTEYVELTEMSAPSGSANTVRLFTEDNGSGKTRLMAQFGSGAAVQIAIEP